MRKHLGPDAAIPPSWQALLDAVGASYDQFDADRRLMACATQVSSDELMSANSRLRQQNETNHVLLERLKSVARSLRPVANEPQTGPADDLLGLAVTLEGLVRNRKEAEDAMRSARDAAQAANRAKSDFLANMSHEIRTPMNAIIGLTSLLLEHPLAPEPKDFAETIALSAGSLLAIIDDILDFSKIEGGHLVLEEHPFDLRECLEQVMDLVAGRCAEKAIELAVVFDPDVPAVISADKTRLRQVLVNLVSNAVKFTHTGGVTVTVSALSAADKLALRFTVEDTGIGISPEGIERLFKAFSQVDSSTTRKYGGTGLGLAISRSLVELMGGSLRVTSELGRGSSFEFSVYLSANPEGTVPLAPLRLGPYPILVVDAHPLSRRALAFQLRSHGASVVETESWAQAHERLSAFGPVALAIVDARVAEGAELARVAPRVVRLVSRAERHAFGAAAAGELLAKPVKPRELEALLRRLLLPSWDSGAGAPAGRVAMDAGFAARHPLQILVVEDNPVNTKVLVAVLKRLGYPCDTAVNGLEALRCCSRRNYDLIIMDVQMPEMDGLDATRELRKTVSILCPPYILALSANVRKEDIEACLAVGMHNFLSKPVRPEKIMMAIERAAGWVSSCRKGEVCLP